MSKSNRRMAAVDPDEVVPARTDGAAEMLRAARRLLDGLAFGGECWHGASLADLPELRRHAAACDRALLRIGRRLGTEGGAA